MKKSLLVVAACALGAIALTSCGASYTELKLPAEAPALDDSGKASFVLTSGTNKVLNALTPKPTSITMDFIGYKINGETRTKVKELSDLGTIYLRDADQAKNADAKYFTVDVTAANSVKYNKDVIYTNFAIDVKSMKDALGTDGIDQYDLGLKLCKFHDGKITLDTKVYTY